VQHAGFAVMISRACMKASVSSSAPSDYRFVLQRRCRRQLI
jgi:hypothetical protein